MKHLAKPQIHELLIYLSLWTVVFIFPLLDRVMGYDNGIDEAFQWKIFFRTWDVIVSFFLLFIVHNFLLLPHFLLKKKIILYTVSVIMFLCLFESYNIFIINEPNRFPHNIERFDDKPPFDEFHETHNNYNEFHNEYHIPPLHKRDEIKKEHHIPVGPYILNIVIALLMLGLNIGIKLLFKSHRDEEILKELEHHNLEQELEYLKYQLNPHFFMNTLNNIHALIDIDSTRAKSTIIELSQLMRYVLYDGTNVSISFVREMEFLKHYIALMRLRYTDKIDIDINFPEIDYDISIPPLLFISFVENAFKHGISYQQESFIKISMDIEGNELFFRCVNSCHKSNYDPASGIGLENVKKRLKLLYGNNYLLNIEKKEQIFDVLLVISINA